MKGNNQRKQDRVRIMRNLLYLVLLILHFLGIITTRPVRNSKVDVRILPVDLL